MAGTSQNKAGDNNSDTNRKLRTFLSEIERKKHFKQFEQSSRSQSSGMFTVSTVTHITADTNHPLISLTTRDGERYLFGKVPEGTQRALVENKFKLVKLKSMFITGTISSWSEIGGLPGLFLTLSDSTKKGIDIITGSSLLLSYVVSSWRNFVFRKGCEIKIDEAESNKIIGDDNLAIKPIKIRPSVITPTNSQENIYKRQLKKLASLMFPRDTSAINDSDPDSYKVDPTESDIHYRVELPFINSSNQEAVSYLIRFLPMRGKFDPQKAKALGLTPGADFRKLSNGIAVHNSEGILVTPEQVLDPSNHFAKMLVLDIPNNSYLQNTITSSDWFLKDDNVGHEDIGIVYHFLGEDIDLDNYHFMDKFPPETKHIICHPKLSSNTLVFRRSAINTMKLKTVLPNNFNLPHFEKKGSIELENTNTFKLHSLQKFIITATGISTDFEDIQNNTWPSLYEEEIVPLNLPVPRDVVINEQPAPLNYESGSLKDNIHITSLGTGSAIPSLYRNVISTLIRIPYKKSNGIEYKSILLDGGENTLGTMMRNFGHNDNAQLTQIIKELEFIFLSHLHADHHLGLVSVINKWFDINKDNSKRLYLIVPWKYDHFIKEWYQYEAQLNPNADLKRISYLSCEEFLRDKQREYKQLDIAEFEKLFDRNNISIPAERAPLEPSNVKLIKEFFEDLGIKKLETTRAIHCSWAYSISITFSLDDGDLFKVSYSGDTRPNPRFVSIGSESDLLIHESTLDNELIEEALAKKHSTMIEAVNVARYMNCPKLLLTHFSSRYSNKANLITSSAELIELSNSLNNYLKEYGVTPNIFSLENSFIKRRSFDDLQICYAFDFMNIRYGDFNVQQTVQQTIYDLFKDGELTEEKIEKENSKRLEKREARRLERLTAKEFKKKRRVSSDEDAVSS
ncbi:beta-lactamase superfamily domain-containing protein [Scheffersomyces amazonensis]|uniref:beta-lactamase superfamily domain-containing protein n=1 Tax=Scheffersomyces amazonensis TaxID=1078765 RepID=UPI00315DACCC